MTLRADIFEAFVDRLHQIQRVNDFESDAGKNVLTGVEAELGDDDPEAVLLITVGDESIVNHQANVAFDLPYIISILVRADLDQPWMTAEKVIGDVKKAIQTTDRSLGGLLQGQQNLRRSEVRTLERESGSGYVGSSITYVVRMVENWDNF